MNTIRNNLILACVIVATCATSNVMADFVFGEPVKFGSMVSGSDDILCLPCDGLEMYIDRGWDSGNVDLYVLKRASVDDDWGPAVNLGPAVNSGQEDSISSISADGLTLYFKSYRPGGSGGCDIYVTTRASRNDPWGPAANMGPPINTSATDADPWISANGLELYFASDRSGGYGRTDIWVARRATTNDPWGVPVNLGPPVNSGYSEENESLSPDGLLLLFNDNYLGTSPRPGGYGGADTWMARRASLSDPWQTPVNLGPKVNGPREQYLPRISPDARVLYFGGFHNGSGDVWQAPIIPLVDLNTDEIVDIKDLVTLIESWGKDNPSADMGPMPWGDAVVDEKDLEILMSYWGQEIPNPALIAHWRLDEAEGGVAADSAGANDGSLIGGPTWQPTDGKVKGALLFDGVDDCVTMESILDPSEGPFSVFAWVKGGDPGQVVVSQQGGMNWLLVGNPAGVLGTELKSGGRQSNTLTSDAMIADGIWHHIGFTWDGSNRVLYVDDVEVARDTQTSLAGSTGNMIIGAGSTFSPGSFWSGLIDDVRIYDRAVTP